MPTTSSTNRPTNTSILIVSNGMIGLDAIQLGHICGYKVLVVCPQDQQDLAKQYGADQVFSVCLNFIYWPLCLYFSLSPH